MMNAASSTRWPGSRSRAVNLAKIALVVAQRLAHDGDQHHTPMLPRRPGQDVAEQ
jgi:hypothetical protein